jgi:hypothetical protein
LEIPAAALTKIDNQVERMNFIYPCYSKDRVPVDYTSSFPTAMNVNEMDSAPFHDASYMEEAKLHLGFDPHEVKADLPSGSAERVFQLKMQSFAVKLMLALTARPSVVKLGNITRPEKIKKGRVKHDALWSPNLVGWDYRAVRVRPDGAPAGSHASPRMHWRKGHWRNQPFGPKPWTDASERRLAWIEPVLINAPEEA